MTGIIDVLIDGSTNGRAYAYDATGFDVKKGDYVKIPPTPFGDPRYAKVIRTDSQYDGETKAILGIVGRDASEPNPWKVGDPCGQCGSTDTDWEGGIGAFCNDCGATDADE